MSMKYLGETFDLHVGGEDLIFPHHENEIAQSQGATGHPFVRHWMHVKHLLIDDETMSKSKGNFFTIPDILERGHRPDAIRYLLAGSHYRKPLNFGFEGLHQAAAALDRIHGLVTRLGEVEGDGPEGPVAEACATARKDFDEALADDLNTPEALAAVHGLVGRANALLAEGQTHPLRSGGGALGNRGDGLGLRGAAAPESEDRLSAEEQALFDERQEARRQREFCPGRRGTRRRSKPSGVRAGGHARRGPAGGGRPESARPVTEQAHRGEAGEERACAHLRRQGLTILERNFRCRVGEIDIVARDGDSVVFVEVKERGDASHGAAVEAVTPSKRRRVIRAARLWAARHGESESPVRFDVVAIDWGAEGPVLRHERAAFDAEGR